MLSTYCRHEGSINTGLIKRGTARGYTRLQTRRRTCSDPITSQSFIVRRHLSARQQTLIVPPGRLFLFPLASASLKNTALEFEFTVESPSKHQFAALPPPAAKSARRKAAWLELQSSHAEIPSLLLTDSATPLAAPGRTRCLCLISPVASR
ncbi:hypothetical protein M441DRAFT_323068 [Trichoderma asperellum CBS 433.97]|uniref:Uncharacterized protein n=1 Tax=Trichoderma asperellum (strain ATCC 204424 / CBS 433.97 / NBRC 101777) TaxID=1042311 RepID=A0A2T3ZLM2_TRIA4|nr:hypothetical protein M441DRAFT_323068 [Trichoderma asperellum CBS 433.97]PTB45701.1 hypothetical protein M441DRAFT_323068 [Trichoderma asperellum CBS 433.97]